MRVIDVPTRLLWDWDAAPDDELWRLQRIIDFFPEYGRDRATVAALARHLKQLEAPEEVRALVRMYAEHYDRVRP